MKLFDCGMAPNPRRARIFIKEKNLDIETQEVSIIDGENLEPEYIKINPWGTLPALQLDDGTVITEATSIFRYIETLYPEPNLLGENPIEAATIESWERFSEMQGMQAVGEYFRNSNELFKNRAMPGYAGVSTIPELVTRGKARVAWFYQQLESRLATEEYLAGERYTASDITALCAVDFGIRVGLTVPDDCIHTKNWHSKVSHRPGTQV